MAHNIENRNGKDSIVWTGETPWHKLGQKVANAFSAEVALKEGGLDFTVEKIALQTTDGQKLDNRYGLRRTDTKDILGVVTDFYQPLQNRDAFGFFDALFGANKARYEVAGVLGKGEKVWLLARMGGEFQIGKGDSVEKFLLLTNGHDTSEPVRAKFTPIRVVCQNTLTAALRGKESEIRVQHIGKVAAKLELAAKLLKTAGIYFDEIETVFQGFARKQVTEKVLRNYVTQVVCGRAEKFDEISPIGQKTITRIEALHETGRGHDIKGVRGSLWGAYNAVVEYVDHDRASEDIGPMLGGRGAQLKERAFSVAQDMCLKAN